MANAVIVGNLMGEKKCDHAFRAGLITMVLGVLLITAITVAVVVFAPVIAAVLSPNDIVVRESIRYIRISMISKPFMAMALILGGALNGAGDTKGVMLIIVLGFWIVRIPLCFILGIVLEFGAPGVWWSMNISIFVYALFIFQRYNRRKWFEIGW
jgi:Na+-driven multidrug efflux pump